ncbi:hypothetical protein [Xenorhabdus ishibashii]|uniref:Uncharacterized protein n=1 Tax=Xenorhabdus ishibashii TaxID=1034471 RepID=A0A2D0KCS3_9GAMM|nr:hypothetical protein [Xenorhabdus ishibashii]PHM61238.1 hypothetical protein Xish_00360 [Xenorhabdus ishibashii]
MAKHIHADLISEYARLSHITDRPWEYFEFKYWGDWLPENGEILFLPDREYRLKPRTIRIGEYDVPEPVSGLLEYDQEYYYPIITDDAFNHLYRRATWDDDSYDNARLKRDLIHLDRESAELHAKALISLTQK